MAPNSLFEAWALNIAWDAKEGRVNLIPEEAEEYLLPVLIAMGEEEYAKHVTEEVIGRRLTKDEIKKVRRNKRLREGKENFIERLIRKLRGLFRKKRWIVIRTTFSNDLAKDTD
ncbi:MAG: hypothetical protein PHY30_02175 [Candidatus Pacebacteria bacterium]|nr:hypothetical protein [Candidatus Paceibacterota bacterium]